MDWNTILNELPSVARPDTITAIEYVRDGYKDRGDNDVSYEGENICYAIDVGFGLVKICFLYTQAWIDIPDYTELQVAWDEPTG